MRLSSSPQRRSARSPIVLGPHGARVRACNVPSVPFISRSANARPALALHARSGGRRRRRRARVRLRSRAARVPRASGRSTLDARPPPVTRGGSLRRRSGKGAQRSQPSPAARPARISFRGDTRVGAASSAGAPRGRYRPHLRALARRRVQRLVETAAELTTARYAALGVIDTSGNALERFVTHGIDEATTTTIGDPPHGRGILGVLIHEAHPLRLHDLNQDPRSVGFPPGHPPMRSFLGVPVVLRGVAYGNLYLTEKDGGADFTEEDEELVEAARGAGCRRGRERAPIRVHDALVASARVAERDRQRPGFGARPQRAARADRRTAARARPRAARPDRAAGRAVPTARPERERRGRGGGARHDARARHVEAGPRLRAAPQRASRLPGGRSRRSTSRLRARRRANRAVRPARRRTAARSAS